MISGRTTRDRFFPIDPRLRQGVVLEFFCSREQHGSVPVRRVGIDELGGQVWYESPDGSHPVDPGRPTKLVLSCPRCRHKKSISEANLKEALNALWQPGQMRVVPKEIYT